MHVLPILYLFFVCLYVNCFLVLKVHCQLVVSCVARSNASRDARQAIGSDVRCELSQLVADHVFRYGEVHVILAIVYLELETEEVGQDGCGARLRLDRGLLLSGLRRRDGDSAACSAALREGSLTDLRQDVGA